jgi:hypothetical protein
LGTLSFFILVCVFLIGSLKAASTLSKDGAQWSQKTAGKLTAGVVGRVGRNTVGRGMNKLSQSERLKDMAASDNMFKRNFARGALATTNYGASASYDVRGISAVGKNKFVQVGDPQKGGFKKQTEDAKKAALKRAKDLGEIDIDSPEGKNRVAAREAEIKKQEEKRQRTAKLAGTEFQREC